MKNCLHSTLSVLLVCRVYFFLPVFAGHWTFHDIIFSAKIDNCYVYYRF